MTLIDLITQKMSLMNFVPSQPGFGYQQQLVPGMRPGGPLMPNMFVPMVQQGQQGPRHGGRRGNAGPMQQGPQPVPIMQQQVCGTLLCTCLAIKLLLFFLNVTYV